MTICLHLFGPAQIEAYSHKGASVVINSASFHSQNFALDNKLYAPITSSMLYAMRSYFC